MRVKAGVEPVFAIMARIQPVRHPFSVVFQEAKMSRLLIGGLTACVIGGVAFAQGPSVPAMPKEYQEMAAAMAAAQAKAVRPGDEALGCAAIEKELMQLQAGPPGRGAANPQATAAMAAALATAGTTPQSAVSQQALAQALATQQPRQAAPTPQQAQAMQALAAQQAAAIQQAMAAQQKITPQQAQAMQQALAAQGMTPQQIQAMQTLALQQAQALSTPQVQAALAAQNAQLAHLQDPSSQLAMVTTVMPQMLRGQRLIGLAMAKNCPSLGAALPVPGKK
jgi:hypothetical protein